MKDQRRSPFTYNRRQFWRALLQEVFVFSGSVKGGQAHQLSELSSLPDHQLARVKPVVNPEYEIFVDQDHVWSKHKKTEATLRLFPTNKENLAAFNLFNGMYSLGEIGQQLSQEMNWDEARAFAHARDLFLSLAIHLVCVPRDPFDSTK